MNKFRIYFIVLITGVTLFSCTKDKSTTPIEPPRAFADQYKTDISDIETYLKENYFTVIDKPGFVDDQDVTISTVDTGRGTIWSYLNAATYPKLLCRTVNLHGIEGGYKLYYLMLRPGVGVSPCNLDGVLAAYSGSYLSKSAATGTVKSEVTATFFENSVFPDKNLSLNSVIRGWSEIFPQFKMGTSAANEDGTTSHYNFGAGVMFIPSAFAYYNSGSSAIPAYSPLVFSFKLYEVQRLDQDDDGIPSFLEDLNNDGYIYYYGNTTQYPTLPTVEDGLYADDTDRDGIPNALDIDDDGDNYTTRIETQYINPEDPKKVVRYYPFNGALDDNPITPFVDERQGIPSYDALSKTFDYTSPNRTRIHLDDKYPVGQ